MGRDPRTTRTTKTPARTGSRPVRRVKAVRGKKTAAVPGTPGDSMRAKCESWIAEQLKQADALARDYHEDFLKSRSKDLLKAGVRARTKNTLDAYGERLEKLSSAFRDPPVELRPHLDQLKATSHGMPVLEIFFQARTLLNAIRTAIESARSRLAAPLSEEEEQRVWASIEKIGFALESLRKFIADTLPLINEERLSVSEPDEQFAQDPDKIEQALQTLQVAMQTFTHGISSQSPTVPVSVPDYLDAISRYRSSVTRELKAINEVFPFLPEPARLLRTRIGDEPLAARIGTLRSMLESHVNLLCTALAAREAFQINLPGDADDAALKLREVIAELGIMTAAIDVSGGDELARCDTLAESDLPDLETLAGSAKEKEQLQAIVDSLLDSSVTGGPEQTMTVKGIAADAARLGRHRCVNGLSEGSVRVKLRKLIEGKVVRRFPLKKTKLDQTASDQYRLSIPAQKNNACHAPAVRAEFEAIAAGEAAADPLD